MGCYTRSTMMETPTREQEKRPVLVYRDRIGVLSEIEFSRRQYLGFRTLRPVWIGRMLLPDAGAIGSSTIHIGGVRGLLFRHFGVAPDLDFSDYLPVVHAQFARGGALALPLAQAMNAKLVVTLHGGDVGKDKNWRSTRCWRAAGRRSSRGHTGSFAYRKRWPKRRRGAACRTAADSLADRGRGARIAALPAPRLAALLFAGRFVEKKGISVLADAMRRLRVERRHGRQLICAGDGPLRPVLEALARDIPGVELVGWLSPSALEKRMGSALALVVPSVVAADGDAEGLPSVVPEAMARGCTVIGTDQGGIAEAVTDGATGLLVPRVTRSRWPRRYTGLGRSLVCRSLWRPPRLSMSGDG